MTAPPVFRLLARESLRDAARRRIVPAVVVLCLLTLGSINRCTTCNAQITTNGTNASSLDVLGWVGVSVMGLLAVWSLILAGMLASDHLSASLEDGSGLLVMARPVSRRQFALARLAGTLVIAQLAAIVMMGGASGMLSLRGDLAVWPALLSILATLINCITVAALAMLSSFFLPRIVTFMCVVGGVAWTAIANAMSVSGLSLGIVGGLLDGFGPPILTGVVMPLAVWSGQAVAGASALDVVLRLGLWASASVFFLLFIFDRQELTGFEPR